MSKSFSRSGDGRVDRSVQGVTSGHPAGNTAQEGRCTSYNNSQQFSTTENFHWQFHVTEGTKEKLASLRVQLVEVNSRTRHYAARIWQLPLAYFGLIGVSLATIAAKHPSLWCGALLTLAGIGVFVSWHLLRILRALVQARKALQSIENMLDLPTTHSYSVSRPFLLLSILFVISFFTIAGWSCIRCASQSLLSLSSPP